MDCWWLIRKILIRIAVEGNSKYKNKVEIDRKVERNQKKGRDNYRGKCRANVRGRHFKDNGKYAQRCEMIRYCKEAALGQKRKKKN